MWCIDQMMTTILARVGANVCASRQVRNISRGRIDLTYGIARLQLQHDKAADSLSLSALTNRNRYRHRHTPPSIVHMNNRSPSLKSYKRCWQTAKANEIIAKDHLYLLRIWIVLIGQADLQHNMQNADTALHSRSNDLTTMGIWKKGNAGTRSRSNRSMIINLRTSQ